MLSSAMALVAPPLRLAGRPPDPERIIAAALRTAEELFALSPPARHHDLLQALLRQGADRQMVAEAEQGFLTSAGRFVDRQTAWHLAEAAGQIRARLDGLSGMLFTENLW